MCPVVQSCSFAALKSSLLYCKCIHSNSESFLTRVSKLMLLKTVKICNRNLCAGYLFSYPVSNVRNGSFQTRTLTLTLPTEDVYVNTNVIVFHQIA